MKFLVYETQADAEDGQRIIFDFGCSVAAGAGYDLEVVDGVTMLHGKSGGVTTSPVTSSWSPVRERLDGKWVVLHPQHHRNSKLHHLVALSKILPKTYVVEQFSPDWFPQEDEDVVT